MHIDARTLRVALRDGPVSLGQLRRDRDWQPEKLLQLVTTHPDQFQMTSVVEGKHQHPAIEAGSELEDDAKAFIAAVRVSGKTGITNIKLWRTFKVKSERSRSLAGEFPDLVEIEQRGLKTYFFWKPKREAAKPAVSAEAKTPDEAAGSPPEPFLPSDGLSFMPIEAPKGLEIDSGAGSELEKQRDELIKLCKDGTRSSDWLSGFGYDMELLVSLVHSFPQTFHGAVTQLSRVPSGAFLNVSLRRPETPEPESTPVLPTRSLEEPLSAVLGPEELKQASWKPAARGMGVRRNSPQGVRGGQVRPRKPLVDV